MSKGADEKRVKILEAAKVRFSHYGMAKTTMAEIAKDLAFSKALLYYYFPDKNSLFYAILEYVIEEEFKVEISNIVSQNNAKDVESVMMSILDNRMKFIKKYYHMFEQTFASSKSALPECNDLIIGFFDWQKNVVSSLLRKGVESGELAENDTDELAQLLLLSQMGVRYVVIKDLKSSFVPDNDDFDYILSMQKKMTKIFIQGLRC